MIRQDLTELNQLLKKLLNEKLDINSKKRRCCVKYCPSEILYLFACKMCRASQYICKPHFSRRSISKICPVCKTSSISKNWLNPLTK